LVVFPQRGYRIKPTTNQAMKPTNHYGMKQQATLTSA
jgi:hypothetical protein